MITGLNQGAFLNLVHKLGILKEFEKDEQVRNAKPIMVEFADAEARASF